MKLSKITNKEFKEGRARKEMASGVEHTVYASTDEPDVIYKLGPKKTIDTWYEIFKNNPSIFPKVYKRGKTKIKLKYDKVVNTSKGVVHLKAGSLFPVDYVKLEKLDTKRVLSDWNILNNAIEDILEREDYEFEDFLISYMQKFDVTLLEDIENNIHYYPEAEKIFKRYVNLIDKIMSVRKDKNNIPDLHRNNFGYDKSGNLKCLDF